MKKLKKYTSFEELKLAFHFLEEENFVTQQEEKIAELDTFFNLLRSKLLSNQAPKKSNFLHGQ